MFIVFALNGLLFANWFSRLPTVRDMLDLDPSTLGAILLFGAGGSLLSMPLTGLVVSKIGARNTVLVGASFAAVGLAAAATATAAGTPVGLGAAMFFAMIGIGSWDVAMNFAGTRVEQGLRREIMPWFHGGYSLGTVAGAAAGTFATRADLAITTHMYVATGIVWVLVAVFGIGFLREPELIRANRKAARAAAAVAAGTGTAGAGTGAADSAAADADVDADAGGPAGTVGPAEVASQPWWAGWTERRTVLIGLVVLAAALTEGAANDWLALAVVDGFGVANDVGAFSFTIFVTAMTVMRFGGVLLITWFSRVVVLRLCVGLAIVGLALFTLAPMLPLAIAGAVLWGLGAALGFPIGMSAASDEPERAAARLSVVSTIGYTAFLAGPPLLGLLADYVGYRHALLAIMVPLVVGFFVTHVAAPPKGSLPAAIEPEHATQDGPAGRDRSA